MHLIWVKRPYRENQTEPISSPNICRFCGKLQSIILSYKNPASIRVFLLNLTCGIQSRTKGGCATLERKEKDISRGSWSAQRWWKMLFVMSVASADQQRTLASKYHILWKKSVDTNRKLQDVLNKSERQKKVMHKRFFKSSITHLYKNSIIY